MESGHALQICSVKEINGEMNLGKKRLSIRQGYSKRKDGKCERGFQRGGRDKGPSKKRKNYKKKT